MSDVEISGCCPICNSLSWGGDAEKGETVFQAYRDEDTGGLRLVATRFEFGDFGPTVGTVRKWSQTVIFSREWLYIRTGTWRVRAADVEEELRAFGDLMDRDVLPPIGEFEIVPRVSVGTIGGSTALWDEFIAKFPPKTTAIDAKTVRSVRWRSNGAKK